MSTVSCEISTTVSQFIVQLYSTVIFYDDVWTSGELKWPYQVGEGGSSCTCGSFSCLLEFFLAHDNYGHCPALFLDIILASGHTSLLVNCVLWFWQNQGSGITLAVDITLSGSHRSFESPDIFMIYLLAKDVYSANSIIEFPHPGHQKSNGSHMFSHHTNFYSLGSLQELLDFFKITQLLSGI